MSHRLDEGDTKPFLHTGENEHSRSLVGLVEALLRNSSVKLHPILDAQGGSELPQSFAIGPVTNHLK
jgi:hypothetical protein